MAPTRLLALWGRLSRWPGGRWLFARLIGRAVPYTGSIGARVEALAPGLATVTLRDRRGVRNHLGSIHAIALANLAEMASGLAMLAALEPGVRGIVTRIEIVYLKKARGTLTATGTASPGAITEPVEHFAHATIVDAAGESVAETTVTWRLDGPR
ncbi:MAG TPA: hotdog fold domain-containing protein [Gemmatimonadales bacterium]|nr:hotdog fold domain-containing protein [Gemmatimonadales bacterium]